ncbi:MAG: glycoside hydrolase family 3 C-terminal domain-containing protein, partial [Bacteroidales bacterium]|nr:glycoside hydrolase family 3 C-terminal domain-containing protein [Bacteroidales bacterium]
LRRKWGYDAIVLTDCDAINNFYTKGQHETHENPLDASVDAVLNGTDLECGKVFMCLTEGLKKGLISEADLDGHLRKTLRGRFELGMFDPPEMLPWANIKEDVISCEKFDELATQAARESMVLLKNSGVLPLQKNIKNILVVGPNADDTELLNGNYGGTPTDNHKHSLLEGIRKAVPNANVTYVKGCELTDEYNTTYHLGDFNNNKGVYVEFFDNNDLSGSPKVTGYYNTLNFNTFGAYGFAEGIPTDKISVRITGEYTPTFTGKKSYTIMSDNGYVFTVNGMTYEVAKPGNQRGGFFRRAPEYKTFDVERGKPIKIQIEYKRGTGPFAMLRADICERQYADFADVKDAAKNVDAVIVIGGISAQLEGEGGDKADIELPNVQRRLIKAVSETGKPLVYVNCSGSCIAFDAIKDNCNAILQAWYPGQGGAKALADVIFGDFNPSGKLPVTFYGKNSDLPDFLDYSMENRTYKYFRGEALYPFGYGLSYTTFEYGKGSISASSMDKNGTVTVSVPVKNTGKVAGEEIVQVYVKALDYKDAPIKSLQGFAKLSLKPGETKTATITLNGESFEYYDETIDELSVFSGRYKILYGSSSLDKDLQEFEFAVR